MCFFRVIHDLNRPAVRDLVMRTLYYLWLHPFSRKVRVVMAEKGLDFSLELENIWQRRTEFLALNPAGDVPVLVEEDGTTLANSQVICEYLEEVYPEVNLLGDNPVQRSETRRLVSWFDVKFETEVTRNLVGEKVIKPFLGQDNTHAPSIRAGYANIHYHLDYIGFLTEKRAWLAGNNYSLADITAAAHLSCIDYLGDVPWEEHPAAREWFEKVTARHSFNALKEDTPPHLDTASSSTAVHS